MATYPNAQDLLDGVVRFLNDQVAPALDDRGLRFRTRIAAHLIACAQREFVLGAEFRHRELKSLLECAPILADELQDVDSSATLEDLNRRLAERIEDGTVSLNDEHVFEHFLTTLKNELAIVQPQFDTSLDCESMASSVVEPESRD